VSPHEIIILKLFQYKSVDFSAYFKKGKQLVPVRICAVKKDAAAIEKNKIRYRKLESRRQRKFSDESKFMNNYIVIATSLSSDIPSSDILELREQSSLLLPLANRVVFQTCQITVAAWKLA